MAEGAMAVEGAGGIAVLPVRGLPEVRPGDDLPALILDATQQAPVDGLRDGDIVVLTHKIVAKAEGCVVDLTTVEPSVLARTIADRWAKDARQVEVVLRESARIVRMDRGVILCETRHGFVCTNAGVDRSNSGGADLVLTLPADPDATARRVRGAVQREMGVDVAVIVSDTFGRPWREGLVNVAIGLAGMLPLRDERGRVDAAGYELAASVLAVADEVAAAAELVMGKLDGIPAAVVRGYPYECGDGSVRQIIRPPETDMFR